MKKVWLVIALAALAGLAINTYADVQNIRLSGDIRIRGYYISDVTGDSVEDQVDIDDSFISQRTRVTVEADLEDHVLVVVTLKAEGLWGSDDEAVHGSSGAGFAGFNGRVNRGFDVGINEAYVQLNEAFFTPATLKLGRQYLHYGHGLIISSVEQEYNYDAARLVLDYYPLVLDLVYAKGQENTPFAPRSNDPLVGGFDGSRDVDVFFLNARYEMTDSVLKNVEGYFGYLANNNAAGGSSRIPPSAFGFGGGDSPMLIGVRADLAPSENLGMWVEAAYEFGSATAGESIDAWLGNIGMKYTMKDATWSPAINANFIYASGGGGDGQNYFRPWFDYVDGYNGYLLAPVLSNIMVFNLGASVKPYENTTLALQAYYYMVANTVPGNPGIGVISNPNVDFGGLGYSPSGTPRDLGYELDAIVGYDYSKDVRCQLVYAAFFPLNGYTCYTSDAVAHLLRGEVTVKF